MGTRASLFLFVLLLLGADAMAIAALRPGRGSGAADGDDAQLGPSSGGAPGRVPGRVDDGWALCQTRFAEQEVTPASVAITYLDWPVDAAVGADEIRAWMGSIDGIVVDVYKLEQRDGRRRVALEITRGKWPGWEQAAAGLRGETVCSRIRAVLLDAGVGRPAPAEEPLGGLDRARHDFEFIYARRARLYRSVQWAGTLDQVLEPDVFMELRQWLEGSP